GSSRRIPIGTPCWSVSTPRRRPRTGSAPPRPRSTGWPVPSPTSQSRRNQGIARRATPAALAFRVLVCKCRSPGAPGVLLSRNRVAGNTRKKMKVTLERNHLLKSLGHVHRVVERRNTYPILANVLLKAADGSLDLRATDLDIEVTESVPAMVGQAGTTTVPAHTLYEIVRKLADGAEVRLENEGSEQLLVSSGRSRFNLACLSPDSFPDLKSGSFTHTFQIPATVLRELIERTQFAISNEETRYYLNGIYLHTLEGNGEPTLRAVATDAHRMARAEAPAPAGAKGMAGL